MTSTSPQAALDLVVALQVVSTHVDATTVQCGHETLDHPQFLHRPSAALRGQDDGNYEGRTKLSMFDLFSDAMWMAFLIWAVVLACRSHDGGERLFLPVVKHEIGVRLRLGCAYDYVAVFRRQSIEQGFQ